ncbi:hypothetical protein N7481_010255 [Penicillium waksmanii]|uniref:uncharacterized protein n=1 Tax=Penicillium waksmanii TaxID=69791 RepID=UPI00254911F5|nr:uncharacterized protein N7481_010255 [Penicillium waksmanii]KAJ5976548.1 hypothetical protein N7481_010255 [Penicillium waksmanii]
MQESIIGGDTFIAVTSVPFTVVPRCFLKSSLLTSTLRELRTRVENAEKNSCLVHIIHILREKGRIGQLSANDGKPVSDFVSLICRPSRFQSIARSRRSLTAGVVGKNPAVNSFPEVGL